MMLSKVYIIPHHVYIIQKTICILNYLFMSMIHIFNVCILKPMEWAIPQGYIKTVLVEDNTYKSQALTNHEYGFI